MTNNDVLRRIRYTFNFHDSKMMAIFALADYEVDRAKLSNWLKPDDHEDFENCSDRHLAVFLNGLINDKRGKREGEQPVPEKKMSNNIVLVKLKIALNLKAEDILTILELADFRLSKHELSAFFRKPGHKHYRECKDQVLRNFMAGLQTKHRPTAPISRKKDPKGGEAEAQSESAELSRPSRLTPDAVKKPKASSPAVHPSTTKVPSSDKESSSGKEPAKDKPDSVWKWPPES